MPFTNEWTKPVVSEYGGGTEPAQRIYKEPPRRPPARQLTWAQICKERGWPTSGPACDALLAAATRCGLKPAIEGWKMPRMGSAPASPIWTRSSDDVEQFFSQLAEDVRLLGLVPKR